MAQGKEGEQMAAYAEYQDIRWKRTTMVEGRILFPIRQRICLKDPRGCEEQSERKETGKMTTAEN